MPFEEEKDYIGVFVVWCFLITCVALTVFSWCLLIKIDHLEAELEDNKLQNVMINFRHSQSLERPIGLAYEEYICVNTKGQTITDVLELCTHEYAHAKFGLKDGWACKEG